MEQSLLLFFNLVEGMADFVTITAVLCHYAAVTSTINWEDFSFTNCQAILGGATHTSGKPAMRAVQHGEGDSDDQIYVTCGLFTHGRVHGLIRASKDNDAVLRFLNDFNDFNKHRLGEDATWTSVSVTKNIGVNVHRYSNNHKGSLNCSTTVGQDSGGDLWLEEDIDEDQVREGHVVWKRDRTNASTTPPRSAILSGDTLRQNGPFQSSRSF